MKKKNVLGAEPKRSFGGKIDGFVDKNERAFEKKHLKGYLNGDEYFIFGKDADGKQAFHKVKEIWS